VIFLTLGGYTEWHYLHLDAPAERTNNSHSSYRGFLHHIFFFLGFLSLSAVYFAEKRGAKALSLANTAQQKEIDERKRVEEERERLIRELKAALSEVKTLSGLLPICASCKKIRDDKGYWNQIESYIRNHSEAEFSHSICPDCGKKLYGDYYKGEKTKRFSH